MNIDSIQAIIPEVIIDKIHSILQKAYNDKIHYLVHGSYQGYKDHSYSQQIHFFDNSAQELIHVSKIAVFIKVNKSI